FGLGGEVRIPLSSSLRTGVFYEVEYGTADVDNEIFFQVPVEGEYRYFAHAFTFFGDLPISLEKPFKGVLCPRIGIGAFVYRASADFSTADNTKDWDIDWIAKTGFLCSLQVTVLTEGGLYAILRGEFVGRGGVLLGVGSRF
ncbi:MAG: hypothetical protein ACYTHM_22265, partial [Planctomycetota bacterium]